MLARFLETLKTHEIGAAAAVQRLPHYSSTGAVSLFMRRPDTLDEIQREHLAAFRLAAPSLETTYLLAQDFLVMMRRREGARLDAWLTQVHESGRARTSEFCARRGAGQSRRASRLNSLNQQRSGRRASYQNQTSQAHDVWKGRFCTPTSTCSAPHLKTSTYLGQQACCAPPPI
jgi:hypothetical protein